MLRNTLRASTWPFHSRKTRLKLITLAQSHVLEAHLQRQLDVPAVPGSREPAGIRPDDSIAIGWVINEVCAVQDVEKFRPELQVPRFTQKPEGGVLVQ